MKIQRYNPVARAAISQSESGEYVRLADVDHVLQENARLRTAIEFAIAPDLWIRRDDDIYEYRYPRREWYVDVLKTALASTANPLAELEQQVNALAAEGVLMRQIIDSVTDSDNEPQYHDEGMGCGLEDRNITDRYEAMSYGWDQAMDRVYGEVIPRADQLDFSTTDSAIREIMARGVEEFADFCGEENSVFIEAKAYYRSLPDAAAEFTAQLRAGKV